MSTFHNSMIITEMPVFTTFWVEKITILKQARDGPICIECRFGYGHFGGATSKQGVVPGELQRQI